MEWFIFFLVVLMFAISITLTIASQKKNSRQRKNNTYSSEKGDWLNALDCDGDFVGDGGDGGDGGGGD